MTTGSGQLAGVWDKDVAVFRGVPFAAPPVGPDRWRPPRPPAAWTGVRPATEFAPAPVQSQPPRDSIMFQANFADRRTLVMSEDCLYLNVWTPDPSALARLPVLVWVHGGGNRYGYGSQDIYDGRGLASRELVVVTLNYRLGALGFLAHPELSTGNHALLDVLAALEWVRQEIAAFGGDPARVTLAGNSAGAAMVCHLMAAPRARGLFSHAIGQSASGVNRADGPLRPLAEAEADGVRFADALGGIAALRARSAVELAATGHFGPILDGTLLVRETQRVFETGQPANVPLLLGTNLDEGSHFVGADTAVPEAFHDIYPANDPASARNWTGDTRFVWPVWRWASLHRAPVWMYRLHRAPPLPAGLDLRPPADGVSGYGCFHTAELPYVWDNLRALSWPWQESDHALARDMADTWARFAATGNPNGGDLPAWPRFSPDDPQVMHFDDRVHIGQMDRLTVLRRHDQEGNVRPCSTTSGSTSPI